MIASLHVQFRLPTGMGLALAGGIGLSMRTHGLVCDSILGAQLVLANGTVVSC